MKQQRGWFIPILVTGFVHGAIALLPINFGQKNDRAEDTVITFKLVSLPQRSPSPSMGQSVVRPENKPLPPKEVYQSKTISPAPRPPRPIARAPDPPKKKTELPQPADSQESDPATDVAAVEQPAASDTQMPPGPVMLSSELSVICPQMNAPTYPHLSRQRGESGELMLKLELDESGRVQQAQVVSSSGHYRLDEAAIAAVKTWRCNPPVQNGQPLRVIAFQPFSFVLREKGSTP